MENVSLARRPSRRPARRGTRGMNTRRDGMRQKPGDFCLPEYLHPHEVREVIGRAPTAAARLLILIQWRAGLRISEALGLERRDLRLDDDDPVLRVRRGKGGRTRLVPVHPELEAALRVSLDYDRKARSETRIIGVGRAHASRWIDAAVAATVKAGALKDGRGISSHTFRHSYARHLLANGIGVNVLSRWLGHSQLATTLVYLELLPDPAGTLRRIP